MPNANRILRWFPVLPPVQPDRVQSAFELQFPRDALGHKIHVGLGLVWCFFASWPTSSIEIAQLPLMAFALLRLTHTHRMINSWALQPLVLLLALFVSWQAISLAWTPDLPQGLDDLSVMRWAWATWALWPVMDRRSWFIAALAIGFVPGLLMQALHASGIDLGLAALHFNRPPGRFSGWWDPAVGGSLLVACLGLHLPAAVMGIGRTRWIAIAGSLATLIGILATGTRGAWIAAASLILTTLAIAAWRVRPRRRLLPIAIFTLAGCLVLGLFAWSAAGKGVRDRALEAKQELAAISQGDLSSFTGGRVLMAREAVHLFASHPIQGVGIGGFESAARAHLEALEPGALQTKYQDRLHAHAHNTWLHIAASTGLIGLTLAFAIAAVALRGAADQQPARDPRPLGTYHAAPLLALLGLLFISLFDTLHVNSQTAALLATLMGLSLLKCANDPPMDRYEQFQAYRTRMNARILGDDAQRATTGAARDTGTAPGGTLVTKRFFRLDAQTYEPGTLPAKTKELLGLVASAVLRCDDCIAYHIDQCVRAGVQDEELWEALDVALIVGGSIVIPHLRRGIEFLDLARKHAKA